MRSAKTRLVPLRRPAEAGGELSAEAVAFACASGDPNAVAELFRRFRCPVGRYLARILLDRQDADDCLQATFLTVARGRAVFEGRSSVSTWLLGIATNVARHHQRSAARRARLHGALRLVSGSLSSARPDGAVAARETLQGLSVALAALSEQAREAFVLCEIEGLSAREAAQVLRVSEVVVWKRVSNARKRLRASVLEGGE